MKRLRFNELSDVVRNCGFGDIMKTERYKDYYCSKIGGLKMLYNKEHGAIEFEMDYGRIDGRNEIIKRLRKELKHIGCEVSKLLYKIETYEDEEVVYNSVVFNIMNVELIDDNEWTNKILKHYDYMYFGKYVMRFQAVELFGDYLDIDIYHDLSESMYYNVMIDMSKACEREGKAYAKSLRNDFIEKLKMLIDVDELEDLEIMKEGMKTIIMKIRICERCKNKCRVKDDVVDLLKQYM